MEPEAENHDQAIHAQGRQQLQNAGRILGCDRW